MKSFILPILILLCTIQLSHAQCFPDRHSTNWFDGWMSCKASPSPDPNLNAGHWLLFDLGKRYRIQGIRIWNYNDPALLNRGISKMAVHYSGDSVRWYHDRDIDLEKAPGHNRYEGMDWENLSIPEARYVLLTALENFGHESCFGLGEVLFEAEEVIISGTDEEKSQKEIKISLAPNPFNRQFQAEIELIPDQEAHWHVSDMMGRTWASGTFESNRSTYYLRVLTDRWPQGSYVFSIRQGAAHKQSLAVKIN